jgi:methylmalonyl-CoA mutase
LTSPAVRAATGRFAANEERPALPDPIVPFAEGFAPADLADWRALVGNTLKGATVESLVSEGPDGLAIEPLYEASREPRGFAPPPRGGGRSWDIRAPVRHGSPTSAREAVLEDLAGGAGSVLLTLDPGAGEGAAIGSAEALAAALEGVLIDVAPIAMDAGFLGPQAARWLSAAAKGSPAAPLALHLDPLSAFARAGASPGPVEAHLAAAAKVAVELAPVHPRASLALASGTVVHEAGGSPAEELAFALASALAHAKALTNAGLSMDAALGGIVIGLSADSDPMLSIAKLRAARIIWTRFAGALGSSAPAVIEARSSRRMLTAADPWTNMVRLAAAAFAAAVGGADAIVLGAFTDALGPPTAFARRAARNIQLILMEEGHLGAVADPVAGSGAFENISGDVAAAAWRRFNAIEAAGGLAAALIDGMIADEVAASRAQLEAGFAGGALRLIGVTDFPAEPSRPVTIDTGEGPAHAVPDARLPGPDSRCPALTPILVEGLAK